MELTYKNIAKSNRKFIPSLEILAKAYENSGDAKYINFYFLNNYSRVLLWLQKHEKEFTYLVGRQLEDSIIFKLYFEKIDDLRGNRTWVARAMTIKHLKDIEDDHTK